MTGLDGFVFLRPWWLLGLLLVPVVWWLFRYRSPVNDDHGWQRVIPARLLAPLLGGRGTPGNHPDDTVEHKPDLTRRLRDSLRRPGNLPALLLLVGSLALAGPSWRVTEVPLQQQNDALVIVLDLSLSMLATDVNPDRITLARRKIHDLLRAREGRLTGLVVYAGDAHVVAPLTDDLRTLEGMMPALDPLIMPIPGNRADRAVAMAIDLLEQHAGNGSRRQGSLLLITDGVSELFGQALESALSRARPSTTLNGLLVGTDAGGPIPLSNRGFIRDGDQIVMAAVNPEPLTRISRASGGQTTRLTPGDADLQALGLLNGHSGWQQAKDAGSFSQRVDDGYWLLWALLPLLWLAWRRQPSLLMVALVVTASLNPAPASALDIEDLWQRPEQKGQRLLDEDPVAAAERFRDPDWQASARFRSGDFRGALEAWELALRDAPAEEQARIHFNRGNALAHNSQLTEAVEAWNQALALNPEHGPARQNRDLIESLLNQPPEDGPGDGQGNGQHGESTGPEDGTSTADPSAGAGEPGSQNGQPSPMEQGATEPSPPYSQLPGGPEQGLQQEPDRPGLQPETGRGPETDQPAGNGAPEPGDDARGDGLSQAHEQWLRRIPDDPSGLLRRKFLQQSRQRNIQSDESDTPW